MTLKEKRDLAKKYQVTLKVILDDYFEKGEEKREDAELLCNYAILRLEELLGIK